MNTKTKYIHDENLEIFSKKNSLFLLFYTQTLCCSTRSWMSCYEKKEKSEKIKKKYVKCARVFFVNIKGIIFRRPFFSYPGSFFTLFFSYIFFLPTTTPRISDWNARVSNCCRLTHTFTNFFFILIENPISFALFTSFHSLNFACIVVFRPTAKVTPTTHFFLFHETFLFAFLLQFFFLFLSFFSFFFSLPPSSRINSYYALFFYFFRL